MHDPNWRTKFCLKKFEEDNKDEFNCIYIINKIRRNWKKGRDNNEIFR